MPMFALGHMQNMPIPGALPSWIDCCAIKLLSVFFCPSSIQQRDILLEPPHSPLSGPAKKKTPERCDSTCTQGQESRKCTSCWGKKRRVFAVQEGLSLFLFHLFISSLLFDIFPSVTASTRCSTGLIASNDPSPGFEAIVPQTLLSLGSQQLFIFY